MLSKINTPDNHNVFNISKIHYFYYSKVNMAFTLNYMLHSIYSCTSFLKVK